METGEEAVRPRRRIRLPLRRPRWATVAIGVVLIILLLFVIIWSQRRQLATDWIAGELERRGVQATYRVTRIGFRTQRLEDVVIGDPARPDLTARQVEVQISWGLRAPRIGLVKARGVRLFGRIVDGRVSFGAVDRLLPPPTGKPFEFPDLNVDLADAAIALDTASGRIAAAVEGKGNLSDGFRGEMALRSRSMLFAGCAIQTPVGYGRVAINDGSPSFAGPLRADRILCEGSEVEVANPLLNLDATVAETFAQWRGSAGIQAPEAEIGTNALAGVNGRISFNGSTAMTRGALDLAAAGARVSGFRAGRTRIDGRYALSPDRGTLALVADASLQGVTGGGSTVDPVVDTLTSLDGTPVEPIGDALARAVRRAAQGFDATASLRLVNGPGYGAVRIEEMSAESRNGARLALAGGEGLTYYWVGDELRMDGEFGLTGGGFPAMRLTLNQTSGGGMEGQAVVAPYSAGNARIALAPIRFRRAPGGLTRIDTSAILSGPFNDGYVRGLSMPISGTIGGGFAFGERCTTVSFESLEAAGLRLAGTRLPVCPTGRALVWRRGDGPVQGGAVVRPVRLAGRLGQTPITLAASRLRLELGRPGFDSSDVEIRLGRAGAVNRLDLDVLGGRFTSDGVAGTFTGAEGQIANVPLLISSGRGEWRVEGGDVFVEGAMTVSDTADPPRFWPLDTDNFRLTLRDNQIHATASLHDPETGTHITDTTIDHSLRTGVGRAVLDVPGITFALDGYQPEELTRLTTGVVALVDGTVTGRGEINWNPQETTSTGTFSTTGMDLAAPFGPVEGLTTTINFTDLLGLVSAPGQLAEVDLIRAGIDVRDGRIRYQLLPNSHVRIESGHWPFMGGQLRLDQTLLDFSQPSAKRLTFYVTGMDAATFVQEMEFANIEATGTFDGVIPMIFDQSGGSIVGGRLEARPPGGTLSYVGVVTEAQLGAYGLLAFNALKSLRYDRFIINLDGSLQGEFLAAIELDGLATNTAPQGGIVGMIISQIQKIPFEFDITIRGPFRALIATARSLEDPSLIIQPVLPPELQDLPVEVVVEEEDRNENRQETVQPEESETMP